MGKQSIISIEAVIDYVESHLDGKLELETVSEAVHYSKYHLHRLFTETVGMTIHDFAHREHSIFFKLLGIPFAYPPKVGEGLV